MKFLEMLARGICKGMPLWVVIFFSAGFFSAGAL